MSSYRIDGVKCPWCLKEKDPKAAKRWFLKWGSSVTALEPCKKHAPEQMELMWPEKPR